MLATYCSPFTIIADTAITIVFQECATLFANDQYGPGNVGQRRIPDFPGAVSRDAKAFRQDGLVGRQALARRCRSNLGLCRQDVVVSYLSSFSLNI